MLIPVCIVLVCVFSADQMYSGKHPNTGKGITDYQSKVEHGDGDYVSKTSRLPKMNASIFGKRTETILPFA